MHTVLCDSQPVMEGSDYSSTVAIIVVILGLVVIIGVVVGLIIFVGVYKSKDQKWYPNSEAKKENKKVS